MVNVANKEVPFRSRVMDCALRDICLSVIRLLFVAASLGCMRFASAQFGPPAYLHEEDARFLPGIYHFHKCCAYYQHGATKAAIEQWELAAGWAMKDAQYDLGIAYFKGAGVAADRPRGIAWLALAAERKDPKFSESLAAAWDEATPTERASANDLWRGLRKIYADDVALPKAQARFRNELAQITGSRVGMPGHVTVWTPLYGALDGASYRAKLEKLAQNNFGVVPEGRVAIGPIQPIDAPVAPVDQPDN